MSKITTKNFRAIRDAAKAAIGPDTYPCTDNTIKAWRRGGSIASHVWNVEYDRSKRAYRFIPVK